MDDSIKILKNLFHHIAPLISHEETKKKKKIPT